jgi:excisionase family DNA binding protein
VPRPAARDDEWLSLQEACDRLHVHADTLRLWADRGRIRTFRTPGGHRRFSEADVNGLAAASSPELSLLMDASVGSARLAATEGRFASERWYARFDETAKEKQRELGHDLMRLLVTYASDPDRKDSEALRQLGRRYALLAREVGLPLGDAMRAFHMFEGVVRSSAGRLTVAQGGPSNDLDREIGWFLNEVLIAMVESFAETRT